LSPELTRGEPATPAAPADALWALTLVMYEAIAGHSPLAGATPHWMLHWLARADIPALGDVVPAAAGAVFLAGCLRLDARRRPASAREWNRRTRAALPALPSGPVPRESARLLRA